MSPEQARRGDANGTGPGDWLDALVPKGARHDLRTRRRHRAVIRSLLSISAVVAALFLVFLLVRRDPTRAEFALFAAATTFPAVGVVLLRLTGRITLSLLVTNLAGVLIVGVWAWLSDGMRSVALPWLVALNALITPFGNAILASVTAVSSALVLALLFVASEARVLPETMVQPRAQPALMLISMIFAVAAVVFAALLVARDRERSKRNLRTALAAAEHASRVKTEFLSAISHDLRAPLSAILGFSEAMQRDRAEPLSEAQRDRVDRIAHGGEVLLELVNNLLDVNRLELGQLSVTPEDVALAAEIGHCAELLERSAADREIRVTYGCAPDLVVRVDRSRLRQVLLNLLSNAVKFNHPGGSVTVGCAAENAHSVRIAVADTGRGIPAGREHEVFLPFARLGAEKSTIEGTGMGLTIAKRLTELMGGRIGFDSRPGAGSTFWVLLPRAPGTAGQA